MNAGIKLLAWITISDFPLGDPTRAARTPAEKTGRGIEKFCDAHPAGKWTMYSVMEAGRSPAALSACLDMREQPHYRGAAKVFCRVGRPLVRQIQGVTPNARAQEQPVSGILARARSMVRIVNDVCASSAITMKRSKNLYQKGVVKAARAAHNLFTIWMFRLKFHRSSGSRRNKGRKSPSYFTEDPIRDPFGHVPEIRSVVLLC